MQLHAHASYVMLTWCVDNMQVVPELIERSFGSFELQSDANYPTVWEADARGSQEALPGHAESVEHVRTSPCPTLCCHPLLLHTVMWPAGTLQQCCLGQRH